GAASRIEAGEEADKNREADSAQHQPQRYAPDIFAGNLLAEQPGIGAGVDEAADAPAQQHTESAAQHAHGAGFGEEQAAHIVVAGAQRFHDADFAPTLQYRHHQRVDNPQRRHGERQRAEDAEKNIE